MISRERAPPADPTAVQRASPQTNSDGTSATAPPLVRAETFVHVWNTYSGPAEFKCSDGLSYVLKALRSDREIGRAIFNDQVIARLGALLGAPVGQVSIVDLSRELIELNPQISYMKPGFCHATRRFVDVSERIDNISHHTDPENRPRFAALAVLYGWVGVVGDRQFIYSNGQPHLVHSVDHGHFFPGGPDWTIGSLGSAIPCQLDDVLVAQCGLSEAELAVPLSRLRDVTAEKIVEIVDAPPAAWGVPQADRDALSTYLADRRAKLAKAT